MTDDERPELVEKMWDPDADGWVDMPALGGSAVRVSEGLPDDPSALLQLAALPPTEADLIVSLANEVTRLTARASQVEGAARRLLDACTPQVSALELEHGVDADALYGDLAEALGLSRDRRPEDR